MDCEAAYIALSQQLDGELSPQETQELQEHLAQCPHCRALQAELSALSAALRDDPVAVPAALKESVLAHLPPQTQAAKPPVSIHWRRWGAMAAAAVIVVGSALWFRNPPSAPVVAATPSPSAANSAEVGLAPTAEIAEDAPAIPELEISGEIAGAVADSALPENVSSAQADSQVGGTSPEKSSSPSAGLGDAVSEDSGQSAPTEASPSPMFRSFGGVSPAPDAGQGQAVAASGSPVEAEAMPAESETPAVFRSAPVPPEQNLSLAEDTDTLSGADYFSVLTLSSARGGLLEQYYSTTAEDGSMLYRLPANAFEALVSELDRGGVEYTLEVVGGVFSAPYGLVVITNPA